MEKLATVLFAVWFLLAVAWIGFLVWGGISLVQWVTAQ